MIELPKDTKPLVLIGDVIDKLREIPDKSVSVIVTSPPYWGQRDYGVNGQIGAEREPREYINKMLMVASELKRVLKDEGSYFLNIGDKYVNKNLALIPFILANKMQENGWVLRNVIIWKKTNPMPSSIKDRFNTTWEPVLFFVKDTGKYYSYDYHFDLDSIRVKHKTKSEESPLPLTLTENEYQKLRNKVSHNNSYKGKFLGETKNLGASPGARLSVFGEFYSKQRVHKITTDKEIGIIKFIKSARERKGLTAKEIDKVFGYKDTAGHWFRLDPGRSLPKPEDWMKLKKILEFDNRYDKIMTEVHYVLQTVKHNPNGKNPGDIWEFPTAKITEKHFAVFPEELPRRVISACCPTSGIVLDPFAGSGTTMRVAKDLGRKSIGIELKNNFIEIIKRRCGDIVVL